MLLGTSLAQKEREAFDLPLPTTHVEGFLVVVILEHIKYLAAQGKSDSKPIDFEPTVQVYRTANPT